MPNHTETTLTVTGDKKQLATFVKKHIVETKDGEGRQFDFNTITLCPQSLIQARSPSPLDMGKDKEGRYIALERIKGLDIPDEDKAKRLEDEQAELNRAIENKMKYNSTDWYSFCLKHWGTKWGAYSCHIAQEDKDCFVIHYQTAWSPARPILAKLGTMYPKLTFDNVCVDEGWCYAGQIIVEGENITENFVEESADIAQFMNEHFGREYLHCEKHDCWTEDDDCWECQLEEEAEEERTRRDEKHGLYPDKEDVANQFLTYPLNVIPCV